MMTCREYWSRIKLRANKILFFKNGNTSVHVYKNLSVHTRKSSVQFVTTYYNPFNIQFGLLDDEIAGTT